MSPRPLDQQRLQDREIEILEQALSLLEEIDIAQLTMDRVVERVPFSKGTVYNHFTSKEDLLSGIGNYSLRTMIGLFNRATEHPGSSRERYLGMSFAYLIWSLLRPTLFRTALCGRSPSVQGKTSSHRLEEHQVLEQQLMSILHRVIDQGMSDGSFVLPPHMSKQQVSFIGWANCFGTIMLLSDDLNNCAGRNGLYLEREYFNAINVFLDGLNWQPLSSQYDYRAMVKRLLNERFEDELAQLQSRGRVLMM